MEIKKIQDADVKDKKVILRVGFDVAVENGHAMETFKIKTVKRTLDCLMSKGAKVALMTWLGRPGGKKDVNFSLGQIKDDVQNILGYKVRFVPDCIGEEVKNAMSELGENEIVLLENVRFYPGEGDEKAGGYDEDFAKKLTEGFDILVADAFSQAHRYQASIQGMPKYISAYAGLLLQKEIEVMEKLKNNFARPAIAIIGGAKIETKLPVIKVFEQIYDYVLVGGKIANEALDQKINFSEKVILPTDYADERMDLGPESIKKYTEIISSAKTIVWNGPTGKFEEEEYSKSTKAILGAVISSSAYSVVGGGETIEVLEKYNAMDKISFVSTGGGAMLTYLGGEKMPGIEVLL
jgi:phosphoglycerate kinase